MKIFSDEIRNTIRGAWHSRTIWVSSLLAIVGIIETQAEFLAPFIGRHFYAHVMIFCGAAMGLLRIITVAPLCDLGTNPKPPRQDG